MASTDSHGFSCTREMEDGRDQSGAVRSDGQTGSMSGDPGSDIHTGLVLKDQHTRLCAPVLIIYMHIYQSHLESFH